MAGAGQRLGHRERSELRFVSEHMPAGPIMPDTNVFIALMGQRAPAPLRGLVAYNPNKLVAAPTVAELTWIRGRLSPQHPRTQGVLADLGRLLASIDPAQVIVPGRDEWQAAGEIGGEVARALAGGSRDVSTALDRSELLSDVLIALVARRDGATVITEDRHFDLLAQVMPGLGVGFHDRIGRG